MFIVKINTYVWLIFMCIEMVRDDERWCLVKNTPSQRVGSRRKAIRRWKFLQQENMYQYPHVSQLFILTSVAKPGIPGAIKNGWVCTADYRMLLGTAVRPVPARMPYISRLCDVGATDVKRWWWCWWWFNILQLDRIFCRLRYLEIQISRFLDGISRKIIIHSAKYSTVNSDLFYSGEGFTPKAEEP